MCNSNYAFLRPRVLVFLISLLFALAPVNIKAQSCEFVSPTVQFISISSNPVTGNCEYLVNLDFDVQTNGGNKYVFVHLWKQDNYHFGSGGTALPFGYDTQPTDNIGAASGILFSSLVNIGINSFDEPASFYTGYPPDASVVMANPANMPGITVTEIPVNGTTSKYIIENVKIILPGPCTALPTFVGDAWSTNGASANQVQCSMPGYTFAPLGPTADGAVTCSSPANSFSFSIAKDPSSIAADCSVDVYVDRNGDGLFNLADDAPAIDTDGDVNYHITSSNSPLSISNNALYYPASISANPLLKNNALFLVLKNIVVTNADASTTTFSDAFVRKITNPCSTLPVSFGEVTATMKNHVLSVKWQTLKETNTKEYQVQVSPDGSTWHSIGVVKSLASNGKSEVPLHYSFTTTAAAWSGLALGVLVLALFSRRNKRWLFALLAGAMIYSCTKSNIPSASDGGSVFIRVAQYDTDSATPVYSKVVKVVTE